MPDALEIGLEIFERSSHSQMGLFDKGYWSGKIMAWSMENQAFKIEMFRFVDVLPSLVTSDQVAAHIKEYFLRSDLQLSPIIRAGLGMATFGSLAAKIAASSIRKNVVGMAEMFITGENAEEARPALGRLWNNGFCFTVDILGEAAVSEKEALDYQRRYLDLIHVLSDDVKAWKPQPLLESSPLGPIPRANVSVKCSSLFSQMDNMAFRDSVESLKARLRPILKAAIEKKVFVNLDMEQNDTREMILTVAEEIFLEPEFRGYPHFGLVIQAYLKSAEADLERVIQFATRRESPITVRLVKGAYWDYETIQSYQRNWEVPVYSRKVETDANYERCTKKLIDAYPRVLGAFGSHNIRSIANAMAYAESKGLEKTAFEIQMLFGMADPFKKAIQGMGYRVREYAPVGEMLPGMAYLVRRLLENTSNEGFLRAKFVGKEDPRKLLADPAIRAAVVPPPVAAPIEETKESPVVFKNEPYRDFSVQEVRDQLDKALKTLRGKLPITVPAVVRGKTTENLPLKDVPNPSSSTEVVTRYALATTELAEEALNACEQSMKTWARRPVKERADILRNAAHLMQKQKNELTALMVLEVGKNLREADADVAEAIDFCLYYADEMEKLGTPRSMGSTAGEANRYLYGPRGPAVAIAPWNFPLAILCGMTVGPLVAGNPVIMKPAEQSSAIGYYLFKLLIEAGVPTDALHLLPGQGEVIGRYLVGHPKIHIINFTGSRTVGLEILKEAATLKPGQKHIKKVVAEMGGKNALIIDEDADLDEAVIGALHSSFGFQGQKCSALSRVLVHESCYDKFKSRLKEGLLSMKVGPADEPASKVGPVIDAESAERLKGVLARNQGKIIAQLEVPASLAGRGNFVPPTIFEDTDFKSELGQQEFFGPFVTLFKVKDLSEAIAAANGVEYALTGGVFSRSPTNIERVCQELEVGNLYVNRGITGALVYKQPFGGFKLSGVGAKAGGPDYLLQFLEPRTITENTMRRGFAPEI